MSNPYEEQLKRLGADPEVVNQYQILCLPENLLIATNRDELVEAGQTAVVGKLLKEAGIRCALPRDVGFEIRFRVRKSVDVWGGLIWICDYLVAPTLVAVLSSWLTAMYITGKRDRGEWPQKPPTVHLSIGITRYGQVSRLQYDGDAESLIQLLRGLAQPENNVTGPAE